MSPEHRNNLRVHSQYALVTNPSDYPSRSRWDDLMGNTKCKGGAGCKSSLAKVEVTMSLIAVSRQLATDEQCLAFLEAALAQLYPGLNVVSQEVVDIEA